MKYINTHYIIHPISKIIFLLFQTVFEIGVSSNSELYTVMKATRRKHKNNIVSFHQKVQEILESKKGKSYISIFLKYLLSVYFPN